MSEPPHSEAAILAAALELPIARRSAYLDEACGTDAALRQRVEALLRTQEHAPGFLDALAGRAWKTAGITRIQLSEKPGDKVGRYKLLQQIGEGGCGVVYMAEQEEPVKRRVALKVIKLGMDTKSVIARFEAERQALALMDHANIAKVLDAGATETGRPYFVMELVRGIKITEFCDENNVSTEERLKLFILVCQAVQHAHQKGVIHRDIKPSNILVTINDGVAVPKVIDFGIAKATQGRLTEHTYFTAFEQLIGTPAYMSPEQAGMTSVDIDTRSDIYSLGVLLYELLTSKTPFDAKELLQAGLDAMRRTILEVEPPKPSTRLSTMLDPERTATARQRRTESPKLIHLLTGDLDWIVMKALDKDRSRRYEAANALATDVQRHLDSEPISARPPSLVYLFGKFARRNRGVLATAAGLSAAGLLALVVLAASDVRITRERNEKAVALAGAQASERSAREQLFLSLRNQAEARRFSQRIGQRLDSLTALEQAARIRPDETLRNEAIAAMALPDIRRGPRWHGYPTGSMGVGFDRLYTRYARLDVAGEISIRSIPEDRELQRVTLGPITEAAFAGLVFSPDDQFLATIDPAAHLRLWRIADGRPGLTAGLEGCCSFAFSSDGRQLAVGYQGPAEIRGSNNCGIVLFDLASAREIRRWPTVERGHSLAFDATNRRLAVGYFKAATVSIYDPNNGTLMTELAIGPNERAVVAWHPDDHRLAVAGYDPRIQIWDVDAHRKLATLEGHEPAVGMLSFHPDGALLLSQGWDGVARLWDSATGRPVLKMPVVGLMQFSIDGRWVGAANSPEGDLELLEIVPSREYRTFGNSSASYMEGEASPDGRIVALGMSDGVHLSDLSSGRELAVLAIGFSSSAFFSSNGDALFTCGPAAGLQRWAIRRGGLDDSLVQLGPPRQLKLPFAPTRACRSEDDQTVAVAGEGTGEAVVIDLATGAPKGPLISHSNACYIALSPDAQWVATSGWHASQTRLWKVQSGEMVREWEKGYSMVAFTPDGHELAISEGGEFSFWQVNPLRLNRRVPRVVLSYPSHIAFSRDGKLAALGLSAGLVDLLEVATGRTVARLESPPGDAAIPMLFNPTDTELVVLQNHVAHVWDLRAIRAGLKPMGLDWDWPEFPPVPSLEASRSTLGASWLKIQILVH